MARVIKQGFSHAGLGARLGLLCLLSAGLSACGGGGSDSSDTQGVDPLLQDYGIAYVKRVLPEDPQTVDVRRISAFNEGGDLYFRDLASPSARERNITFGLTGGEGDVKDVEASYDGTKLVFALRLPEIENAAPEDQPTWNIWEYVIATEELRRVITTDIVAEDGQDVAPHYLPDGRIIFSSSRQRAAKAILLDDGKPQFSALEESRTEPAMVLHVMEEDGTEIQQISFNQSHDLDPVVLDSGEVVFTRWDNMGANNELNLYKMNPDGTHLQLLYGANSHMTGSNGATVQFLQPRQQSDGTLVTIMRPFSGTNLGGDIVAIDTENYIENEQATLANAGVLSGPAQQSVSLNTVRNDVTPSLGGRFNAIFPLRDDTRRAFVSWSPCRLLEAAEIVPCTEARLANPDLVEAPPLYSIYLYDLDRQTQVPLFVPQEGFLFSDVVAAQPRTLPAVILDQQAGTGLDQTWIDENVGVLNIRSVYDFAGEYRNLGTPATGIDRLADPAVTPAADRPARFLRIVKAVGIPDRDTKEVPGSAYGRSSSQLMREVIGYAPIEPDGSVRVKVPANVPLAIGVLDANGRRISDRHMNWLQVRPGEQLACNGCHERNSTLSHGRADAFAALNAGAPFDGYVFPNTLSSFWAETGETMAEVRTRLDAAALNPKVDIIFDDVWTDAATAGRPADVSFDFSYTDLATTAPVSAACQTNWSSTCRIVINYETHIHPLWTRTRGLVNAVDATCTSCHTRDVMGTPQVPAAQLELTDGVDGDHFISYRELFFSDTALDLDNGQLVPKQATDSMGNPLFQTDADGNLVLDAGGNPIPIFETVAPYLSTESRVSGDFFAIFDAGGSHEGRLEPAELKLISEWLDIGAQYYNNPFDVP